MSLRQCQPVGEAGTPWAEIVAGTHSRVQAYQTASSGVQILQPMDESILSCMTRRTDAIFMTNLETMCSSNNLGIIDNVTLSHKNTHIIDEWTATSRPCGIPILLLTGKHTFCQEMLIIILPLQTDHHSYTIPSADYILPNKMLIIKVILTCCSHIMFL